MRSIVSHAGSVRTRLVPPALLFSLYALIGLVAGVLAAVAGSAASWAVVTLVMQAHWAPLPGTLAGLVVEAAAAAGQLHLHAEDDEGADHEPTDVEGRLTAPAGLAGPQSYRVGTALPRARGFCARGTSAKRPGMALRS